VTRRLRERALLFVTVLADASRPELLPTDSAARISGRAECAAKDYALGDATRTTVERHIIGMGRACGILSVQHD
jgi:hypothetical protein